MTSSSVDAQTVVDLSADWGTGTLYNKNKAYCTIQAAMAPAFTRGYVVVQNGVLVAEGYTSGNNQEGKYDAWSATKSWSTFFIGVLVDQGKLTTSETLNDIFTTDADWNGVDQATEKKTITVEEILTMTSGLREGCSSNDQASLQDVLNNAGFNADQRGKFNYLGQTHILAQIILRRSGMTPREFATDSGIFSSLGITDADFSWDTFGGVEGSAYGLKTNPRILAKLGQLYLQNGASSSSNQLVASSWVDLSTMNQLSDGQSNDVVATAFLDGYGYQWYAATDGGSDSTEGAAAALGALGQIIIYLPVSDTTIAINGQGCMGAENNIVFARAIIDSLGDLATEQTICSQSFSYWNYFARNSGSLFMDGLRSVPQSLLGRNLNGLFPLY